MKHILIATATMDLRLSTGVTRFFSQAHQRNSLPDGPRLSTLILEGVRGYAHMRNRACQALFASSCDGLWFVDGDTMPPPNAFDLLDVEGDVVAAAMPYETLTGAVMVLRDLDDLSSTKAIPPGDVLNATAVGCGFTLIRRSVLEDPRLRWASSYCRQDGSVRDLADDPNAAPAIFRYHFKPDGDTDMGEDWDFTYRASRLGYRVRLHRGVECDHLKTVGILARSPREEVLA